MFFLWEIARDVIRLYIDSKAFDHSASLSFFALLSFAPLLILVVSAVGYIALATGPSSGIIESVVTDITEFLQKYAPIQDEQVRLVLVDVIEHRGQFGLFGAIIMLFAASMVFGAFEHAMEDIFGKSHRKFILSRAIFSAILISFGFFLFLTHYIFTLADSFIYASSGMTLDEFFRQSALLDAIITYIPVPIGFLVAVYIPNIVRPRMKNSLIGATLFFFLWEVAREGYGYYVTYVAQFNLLYGSIATPILLILWTFYSANILLLCLCLISVLERKDR